MAQKVIRVEDARQHVLDNEPIFVCENGPASVFAQQVAASPFSTSGCTFVLQPSSVDTILVQDVSYVLQGSVNFTLTPNADWVAAGALFANDGSIGFSEGAISSFIANENVNAAQLNQTMFPANCMNELSRINSPSKTLKSYLGGGVSTLDTFTSLTSAPAGGAGPLLTASDIPQSDSITYGRGQGIYFTSNPAVGVNQNPAVVSIAFTLRLKSSHSFLRSQSDARAGLRGVTSYTISLNFNNNAANLFNVLNPNTGGGVVTIVPSAFVISAATAEVVWLSPSPDMAQPWISQIASAADVQVWTQTASAVASGDATTINIQNVQSDTIPNLLIISATPVSSTFASTTGSQLQQPIRWLAPTSGSNLIFNNQQILTGMNVNQLYEMAKRNGYSQSLEVFRGDVLQSAAAAGEIVATTANFTKFRATSANVCVGNGGFYVIRPGRDCGLSAMDLCGGMKTGWSLTGSVAFFNQSADALAAGVTLRIIAVYDSAIVMTPGSAQLFRGVVTRDEYAELKSLHGRNLTAEQLMSYSDGYGGAFFSSLGNLLKKGASAALDKGKQYASAALQSAISDPLGTLRGVANAAQVAKGYVPALGKASSLIGRAADFVGAGDGGAMLDRRRRTVMHKRAIADAYLHGM